MILFVSFESPSSGVSEADTNTFEKNVQTLKDGFISGYENMDLDKVRRALLADRLDHRRRAPLLAVDVEGLLRALLVGHDLPGLREVGEVLGLEVDRRVLGHVRVPDQL